MRRTMLRMGLSDQDLLELSFRLKIIEERTVGRSPESGDRNFQSVSQSVSQPSHMAVMTRGM